MIDLLGIAALGAVTGALVSTLIIAICYVYNDH